MINKITERVQIIDGFKSIYNFKGKTEERKFKTLKYTSLLDYGLAMILLAFSILASGLTSFHVDSIISGNWEKSGLLVLMTMSLSIRAPFGLIELILKKHSKEIKDLKIDFDDKLNHDLEFLISKFNDRKKYLYIIGLPAILISIAALLQVFDLNPYWDKFPHFVGGVCIYILVRINYDIVRLKRNLRKVNL
jgi:hypothetical protein